MSADALSFPAVLSSGSGPRAAGHTDARMTGAATASKNDAELVAQCLAGEKAAFDVLVERHRRQVYQVCYRFAGNHEDASDLAQDVFLRAYRALGTFKGRSAFATWLYRVAVNVCLNRKAAKRLPTEPIEQREFRDRTGETADRLVMRKQTAAAVRAAISRLPDKQRATMILRIYQELPHEQIASILGSSVGAVKANFFHALANMKKLLREGER
jgi:RNA polymerase sigma-70 factor (ECF subfamily)